MSDTTPDPQLNRAGRRAQARTSRTRKAGAVMAAIPAAFGTTALLLGATAVPAGAATLTVNDAGDAGDGTCDASCTLRDAIDDAVDDDIIVFDASISGSTITLTGGQLTVNYAITIDGTGSDITIDADRNSRHFYLNLNGTGTEVTITGLTLVQGLASDGGSIRDINADLTINDSIFSGNEADGDGGAIHGDNSDIDVTITNTTFGDNYAGGYGGAIGFYAINSMTITGSTFEDNTAYDGEGGAIYLYTVDETVTITGSTFERNEAIYDDGGAIRLDGGGSPVVSITDSTFTDNVAYSDGGALSVQSASTLTISGSTFTGNSADDDGGAIYVDASEIAVSISGSTFSENTADGDGGAIAIDEATSLAVDTSSFEANTASSDGGALYVDDSDVVVSITGSNFTGNTADLDGGAIGIDDAESFSMSNSTVSGNSTIEHNAYGSASGGGIYLGGVDTTAQITNSTVSGNTANDGGGILVNYVGEGVVIANSTISGNTATGNGGGILVRTLRLDEGSETYSYTTSSVELLQTTITANVGTTIGGVAVGERLRPQAVGSVDGGDPKPGRANPNPEKKQPEATEAADEADESVRAAEITGEEVITLDGTIVALNSGDDLGSENETGTVVVKGSLFGGVTGLTLTDQGGNLQNVDPRLGPLQDNGGPTQTHALLDGSPAINAGPDPVADFPGNADDQRGPGYPRVVGGRVDIGAFEAQPTNIEPTFTG